MQQQVQEKQQKTVQNLAAKAYKVIPLQCNSKKPIISDWLNKATSNQSQIEEWSQTFPDCNFGVVTGGGLVVLDVDNKNGKSGSEVLAELGDIPVTYTVLTPNGGYHYYFKTSENIKSRIYGNGLEIRSAGNQVVAPDSILDGKAYKVVNDIELAEFPMWLYEALEIPRKTIPVETKVIPLKQVVWSEKQRTALSNILESIDPDLDYDLWLKVIFASINVYGNHNETWSLLKDWSAEGLKYNEDEFWKKIKSYDPNHIEKLGYTFLIDAQWRYPKKHNPIAKNDFGSLIQKPLLAKVIELLEKYGNEPSKQHLDALQTITSSMANGIESPEKFRLAFPLETGMGKTTCVVALACVLEPLNKSLLICAQQIEQLKEMQDSMIVEGVNPLSIGIYHKLSNKDIPSIKLEDMHKYQFLLVSHSRVNNDSKISIGERLLNYNSEKRSMTIWDESLITTASHYCDLSQMKYAISDWFSIYTDRLKAGKYSKNHSEEYQKLHGYLLKVKEILDGDLKETIIELPNASPEILNRNLINTVVTYHPYRTALETLIKFNQSGQVRGVKAKDGVAIMQFEQVVDECFDKIIVMDASSRIRKLINFDKSVSVCPLGVNKTYLDVEIFHSDVRSSKSSFESNRSHLIGYLMEFQLLLNTVIPKNEPLIIFCHEDYEADIINWKLKEYPLREIHVLHWGQHKATNKFSHVEYILTCGILYRDWKEVASSIIGQTGNLNYSLLDSDVKETYYSEQAEMLYQGFSRGNSRNTKDGKAGKQTIYMFHPSEDYLKVMTYLRRVMSGVKESKYQPKHLTQGRKNARNYLELASSIRDFLISLGENLKQISKTNIRKTVAPELASNGKTWRKAIEKVETELTGWNFDKKMVIRTT